MCQQPANRARGSKKLEKRFKFATDALTSRKTEAITQAVRKFWPGAGEICRVGVRRLGRFDIRNNPGAG